MLMVSFEKTIVHGIGSEVAGEPVDRVSSARFTGTGFHTIYNLSGKIEKKGYFEKGRLIKGEQYVYNADGILSSTLIFENGELVENTTRQLTKISYGKLIWLK